MHSELAIKIGAVAICRFFDFANAGDCNGYASLFAPHLSYIMKNTNLTASQMCGILMGKKCLSYPPSKYETWKIPLPPQFASKQIKQATSVRKSNVRILHLSDFHFDPLYQPGAVTDCPQKICCREMSKGKGTAGYWGHTTNCDAPLHLLKNLVNHLNTSHATDYDLLFWTGDNNPHDDWMTTADSIVFTSTMTSNLIKKHLSNEKIVFPILGNHEGMPANQLISILRLTMF
ncbi:sphingomyelin phosphodiesterase-like protein [Leptotrombidium deliense]|uniref:Sphingomyelin phosphodiesterase-like protein n=1 Tax=Leptotrombidium deliense TaxID=299467 RepID=A0A443RUB2_9ACAR|nr:sphingomyelin phosphodiesterase-like protein [Leptotrombidium deliense]